MSCHVMSCHVMSCMYVMYVMKVMYVMFGMYVCRYVGMYVWMYVCIFVYHYIPMRFAPTNLRNSRKQVKHFSGCLTHPWFTARNYHLVCDVGAYHDQSDVWKNQPTRSSEGSRCVAVLGCSHHNQLQVVVSDMFIYVRPLFGMIDSTGCEFDKSKQPEQFGVQTHLSL